MKLPELTCESGADRLTLRYFPAGDHLSIQSGQRPDAPLDLSRAEVIRLRDALTEFLAQPPAWGDVGAVDYPGLNFPQAPRDADGSAAEWPEPWLVVWPAMGYDNRTGLFRLLCGMKESPVEGGQVRGSKTGYALARLPHGVYIVRTAHADQRTQRLYYLHHTARGLEFVTDAEARMLLVNYGC